LWIGWLFFNGGSTYNLFDAKSRPAKVILNTLLSGSVGGLVGVFVKPFVLQTYSHVNKFDIGSLCNGILVGLVAITGVADRCAPWAAFIVGIGGALAYCLGAWVLDKCRIDDPVEAAPIHLFGGAWGIIAIGIFNNEWGLVSGSDQKGRFFGYQILGLITVFAWVTLCSGAYFFIMHKLGKLRLDRAVEIIGLDIAELGGVSEEVYNKIKIDFGANWNSPGMPGSRINATGYDQSSDILLA
jgi:ammonium transporter, Amt family